MAQLHFYVPDDFAKEIRRRAKQARMPVSKYLVQVIMKEIGPTWPENYFDDVGGRWNGDPTERDPRD